ncbi:MAG: RNA polymerase subunit sigma-70 [Lachnospiraceae bacterium]|nr:RNA polymerase subunit sigma-70 [Lachnospiraceae bacterium]
MTEEQKKKIDTMRGNGIGYGKIAEYTGLSKDSVKSYCRRRNLTGSHAPQGPVCEECGKAIIQPEGRKKKRFCSDQCRSKWWNAHLDRVNKKAYYDFICAYCHKPFTVYGNDHRKYCSHECYINDRFGGGTNV